MRQRNVFFTLHGKGRNGLRRGRRSRNRSLALPRRTRSPSRSTVRTANAAPAWWRSDTLDPTRKYGIALTEKEKEASPATRENHPRRRSKTPKSTTCLRASVSPANASYAMKTFLSPLRAIRRSPRSRPALSIARPVYKGGVTLNLLRRILSYAVKVEEDAAIHFEELATAMFEVGNETVGRLFAQLSAFSHKHLEEAQMRAGRIDAT